jgi:bifunctional UDP-N-acetylglucosamine pyrophosphorylase/glucosamine-1-phosphate N-acetyltransferase
MRSARPKSSTVLCGRPLIAYPVTAARALGSRVVVVVGARGRRGAGGGLSGDRGRLVEQKERLGLATPCCRRARRLRGRPRTLLVLPGDVPLPPDATPPARGPPPRADGAAATLLTAEVVDATGYGRVVREQGRAGGHREHRDATAAAADPRDRHQRVLLSTPRASGPALAQVTPENEQSEYYLTDDRHPASPGARSRR